MGKRTKQQRCPNPLFLKFIEEWREDARENGRKNLQFAYGKAITSLQKYPLPLRNGQEAMILEGIGEHIAKKLDEALAAYQEKDEEDISCVVRQATSVQNTVPLPLPQQENGGKGANRQAKKKSPRKPAEYAPGYRTGAYALLLTLHREHQKAGSLGYMSKDELQRQAQSLSDKSFTLPDPGTRYTSWSSMSTLIKKGLVVKNSSPAKYYITPDGCELAGKLVAVSNNDGDSSSSSQVPFVIAGQTCSSTNNDTSNYCARVDTIALTSGRIPDIPKIQKPKITTHHIDVSPTREESQSFSGRKETDFTPEFTLKPGTFDIVLCVDFIETTGGSSHSRKEALTKELTKNGVNFDVRKLQVGDFLWVACEKPHPLAGACSGVQELVLDYIVERKRMDDLNSSIIDGRFREQKFRLRNCGLRHPIYLVENFGSSQHLSLPETTLKQAMVNTQVIDSFFVKRTQDIKESVAYLTLMTRFIQSFYLGKTLIATPRDGIQKSNSNSHLTDSKIATVNLMTFKEFEKETNKNKVVTVSELFGKQLMQISGMSADKASSVIGSYPTPKRLLEAYDSQPTIAQKETLLSSLKYGKLQRKLGPSLSRLVYQLYCTKESLS